MLGGLAAARLAVPALVRRRRPASRARALARRPADATLAGVHASSTSLLALLALLAIARPGRLARRQGPGQADRRRRARQRDSAGSPSCWSPSGCSTARARTTSSSCATAPGSPSPARSSPGSAAGCRMRDESTPGAVAPDMPRRPAPPARAA